MTDYGVDLNDLLGDKLQTLSSFVQQVEASIRARALLSAHLRSWLDEQYLHTKNKLLLLYAWHFPTHPAVDQRRLSLERSLDALLQEARTEEVACWRDTELLHKELRHWQKQHEDLVQRVRLLTPRM